MGSTNKSIIPVHISLLGIIIKCLLTKFIIFLPFYLASLLSIVTFAWLWMPIIYFIYDFIKNTIQKLFLIKFHRSSSISYFERPQGIVILTRTPIQDKVRDIPTNFGGLKQGGFIERIMAESMCHKLLKSFDKQSSVKLFICHQLNYTSCYEINDWMHQLPNYDNIPILKERFINSDQSNKTMADSEIKKIQELYEQNEPKFIDDDSFCHIREDYFLPSTSNSILRLLFYFSNAFHRIMPKFYYNNSSSLSTTTNSESYSSRIQYVTMRGRRDFSRLLEVAIRAAFAHGCRDVLVLNSHALDLNEKSIEDAMWALSAQRPLVKNQVVLGRSHQGGCYLLGVSYQRKTVLHLRKLTTGVDWSTNTAYSTLCENLSKLGWSSVSLRSHVNEFIDFKTLDLIPDHLGYPLDFLLNETVSVIVPSKDCEDHICDTLNSIVQNASRSRPLQIIVIDAHSKDDTLNKVRTFQKSLYNTVQSAPPIFPCEVHDDVSQIKDRLSRAAAANNGKNGFKTNNSVNWSVSVEIRLLPEEMEQHRGEQVNYAVNKFVKGSYLMIVHPGTLLPLHWDSTALRCLNRLGVVMGAFSYHLFLYDKYIERKNISWALRCFILDTLNNLRSSRYEMPLGSQTFFMFTYYYYLMGQYPKSVLLDDVEMVERAHEAGHVALSQATVTVWPQRALNYGFLRTALLDNLLLLAYKLGASPQRLAPYYNNMVVIDPDYFDGY